MDYAKLKAENDKLSAENDKLKTQLKEAETTTDIERDDLLFQLQSIRTFFRRFLQFELPDEALNEYEHNAFGEGFVFEAEGIDPIAEEADERVPTPRYEEPPSYRK